jgi:hypothetical protein
MHVETRPADQLRRVVELLRRRRVGDVAGVDHERRPTGQGDHLVERCV